MLKTLIKTAQALKTRGFQSAVFEDRTAACDYILSQIAPGVCVGIGGSVTVQELNLASTLRDAGHEVLWHWDVPPQDRPALLRRVMGESHAYLCSANALCDNGTIVQIDGTGNRIAAMCYGPEQVFLLVGRNKLVEGTVNQAIARVKRVACAKNARRLNYHTPCATGACRTAECTHSMCSVTAVFERAPGGKTTHVLLIDEDLGY